MINKKNVLYPVTKKTMHDYARSIFDPIRREECVTSVWAPMSGRRMWNKFIIENISLFDKELPNSNKYLLVYVEPLDLTEESMSGYVRLMGKSFMDACGKNETCKKMADLKPALDTFNDDSASYSKLLEALRSILVKIGEKGFRVVFFLGEFDELGFVNKVFFNNLKSIWSGLYPVVQYVFLMRVRVIRSKNIELWGELNEAILQNIVYVPLGGKEHIDYWVDYFSNVYSVKLTSEQKKVVEGLCGGHPYLLKVSMRILAGKKGQKLDEKSLRQLLRNYYELQSVARGILNVRTEAERKLLKQFAQGRTLQEADDKKLVEFMEKLGLIKLTSARKYVLFGTLFADAVLGEISLQQTRDVESKKLILDRESGAILLNGSTVEEKFTRQEYSVLRMFLENLGELKTRDDIGEVLWGKESYEKYSDWAIDQIMSKIRRKTKTLGVDNKLLTIRGRGYKLI